MTGIHRTTILKLLVDLGNACAEYQSKTLVDLPCKRIQCDEIWSFVGAKEKNASDEKKAEGWGDAWTWVALDADTKLVPCWFVGPRDAGAAQWFIPIGSDTSKLASTLLICVLKPYSKMPRSLLRGPLLTISRTGWRTTYS